MAGAGVFWFHPLAPAWTEADIPLMEDEVTMEMVQERWGGEVVWIDARSRAEREETGEVDGAWVLTPQERFEDQLGAEGDLLLFQLLNNEHPIVVFCGRRGCDSSRQTANYLRGEMGLVVEISVLRGGWRALAEK